MAPAPSLPKKRSRRRLLRVLLVAFFVLAGALVVHPLVAHLRAASLLLRFADEHGSVTSRALADFGRHPVDEERTTLQTANGPAPVRLYRPRGVAGPPGVVLVHGVHRLGIEEPRMVRFARALAASGVLVLTPEVQELADYRVDPRSVDTIGAAAVDLERRTGERAGVMGMSFAGGLALLAAADPRFAGSIGFVVAIGAHDDLARVSRFFAENRIERPDGTVIHLQAHGYGTLVLVYGRVDRFFPPEDVDAARDVLRLWLWDDRAAALARAEDLGPESWAKMDMILHDPASSIAPEVLAVVERDGAAMATVSPHGHLGGLQVPVFLLHGAGDTVIPAVETEWIASEVPAGMLRSVLVSPAIVHVEMGADTKAIEEWELVHFMAGILEEAEADRGRVRE